MAMAKEQLTATISDGLMTIQQAAEFSTISRTRMYALMGSGDIRYFQRDGRRVIAKSDLVAFLANYIKSPDQIAS